MNVASRMESCGVKGKIQCSTETANFLIDAGKGKWVTPRQEKIQAKGKQLGQMCDFFFLIIHIRLVKGQNVASYAHIKLFGIPLAMHLHVIHARKINFPRQRRTTNLLCFP